MNNVQAFLFANLLTGVSPGKGIIPFFIFQQSYVKILDFYTGRDKNQDRFEMGLPLKIPTFASDGRQAGQWKMAIGCCIRQKRKYSNIYFSFGCKNLFARNSISSVYLAGKCRSEIKIIKSVYAALNFDFSSIFSVNLSDAREANISRHYLRELL